MSCKIHQYLHTFQSRSSRTDSTWRCGWIARRCRTVACIPQGRHQLETIHSNLAELARDYLAHSRSPQLSVPSAMWLNQASIIIIRYNAIFSKWPDALLCWLNAFSRKDERQHSVPFLMEWKNNISECACWIKPGYSYCVAVTSWLVWRDLGDIECLESA